MKLEFFSILKFCDNQNISTILDFSFTNGYYKIKKKDYIIFVIGS